MRQTRPDPAHPPYPKSTRIMDSMNDSADELELMERSAKRPRLSLSSGSPEEIAEEWDLQAARAQNDNRLKSIFEGIFSKYGQDFTEVGDEIDLGTGNIVVDNGHLLGMREENDPGNTARPWLYEAEMPEGPDSMPEEQNQDRPSRQTEALSSISNPTPNTPGTSHTNGEGSGEPLREATFACNEPDTVNAQSIFKSRKPLEPVYEDPGPQDPLWQAPELPQIVFSPTAETRHTNVVSTPKLPKLTREASPPGSGSVWAVHQPRRPRTEVKPKATPSKRRPRAKRKHHSSPVVRDWSFAQTPDGNESDDPLQEFQPSPTPLRVKAMNIQGKSTASAPQDRRCESPRQLTQDTDPEPDDQSATVSEADGQSGGSEQGDMQSDVASQASSLPCESSETPHTDTPGHSPGGAPNKSQLDLMPDEVKLLVRMRYVQGKRWNEILDHLPGRNLAEVVQWNALHWSTRHADPPQLSAPWSQAESVTLDNLKDLRGLTWSDIRAELPNRSHVEIEFELLRLWADQKRDDDVHVASIQDEATQDQQEPGHRPESPTEITEDSIIADPEADAPVADAKAPGRAENLLESRDPVVPSFMSPSPSKPSNIHFGSPAPSTPSRPGFRTPKKYNFSFNF